MVWWQKRNRLNTHKLIESKNFMSLVSFGLVDVMNSFRTDYELAHPPTITKKVPFVEPTFEFRELSYIARWPG